MTAPQPKWDSEMEKRARELEPESIPDCYYAGDIMPAALAEIDSLRADNQKMAEMALRWIEEKDVLRTNLANALAEIARLRDENESQKRHISTLNRELYPDPGGW